MTLPVFLHIEATPNPEQMEALQGYLSQVPAIVQAHAGVPVATYDVQQALDGEKSPAMLVVVSFPSRQAIDDFFADQNYQALIPLRDKGFSHLRFFVSNERL